MLKRIDRYIQESSSCTIEDTYINPLTHRVYWFLQEYEGGYVKFGLLRSVDWLYNLGIEKVGDTATFAMEEFGVVGDAQLMQIDRCPEIEMGAGRICTGWFEHSAGQLWQLSIEGSSTPIRGTDRHPIWSNDRLAWVPLSELQECESVQVQGGYAKVQHLQETEDVEKVYTLEIDADHCYRVGQQGLLVHNASASEDLASGKTILEAPKPKGLGCCVNDTLSSVSLASRTWRSGAGNKFAQSPGLGVVYLLRKADGTILKAGKTETGSEQGRWEKYVKAERMCGPFTIIAWAFDKSCVDTLEQAETAIRKLFCGLIPPDRKNPTCPWDNAPVPGGAGPRGERLGRAGPGVPGEDPQGETQGEWVDCQWASGATSAPADQQAEFMRRLAMVKEQLGVSATQGQIDQALADSYKVSVRTIQRWRSAWGS